jgi:hypothetical protein
MKRITLGVLALALAAAPVQAQGRQQPKESNPLLDKEIQRDKENALIDKQYQKTLKQTQGADAPVKTDPWANMRGSDGSKR